MYRKHVERCNAYISTGEEGLKGERELEVYHLSMRRLWVIFTLFLLSVLSENFPRSCITNYMQKKY